MSQPLRIELNTFARARLITTRCIQSRLWFVNNKALEEAILGYVAKYQAKYEVILYAVNIQGNHLHMEAFFPKMNMSQFMRDLNARIAQLTKIHVPRFKGGPLFERRYSEQTLPLDGDVEDKFFYCALQAVQAGLAMRISDYEGYNSFSDAVSDIRRKFKIVDWTTYNDRKRYLPNLKIKDFTKEYSLTYTRLPGYEELSPGDYRKLMHKKLDERQRTVIQERKERGEGFLPKGYIRGIIPGTLPKNTKKSTRTSFRPLILTACRETRKAFMSWYFSIWEFFKDASREFLKGRRDVEFPEGTYTPPLFLKAVSA